MVSASEMTYIVSRGALNPTHSLSPMVWNSLPDSLRDPAVESERF